MKKKKKETNKQTKILEKVKGKRNCQTNNTGNRDIEGDKQKSGKVRN